MAVFAPVDDKSSLVDAHNRLVFRDSGAADFGTQIRWVDYGGDELDPYTGAVLSSNNHTQLIENGAGKHAKYGAGGSQTTIEDTGIVTPGFSTAGNATVGGTLDVTGAATFGATVAIVGNATVGGTFGVTGLATFNGGATIGDAAADLLTVLATATFRESVTLRRGLVLEAPLAGASPASLIDMKAGSVAPAGTLIGAGAIASVARGIDWSSVAFDAGGYFARFPGLDLRAANGATAGVRVIADFGNATPKLRAALQASTGNPIVGILPASGGSVSAVRAYNSDDPTNAGFMGIQAGVASNILMSGFEGAGVALPFDVYIGGSVTARFHATVGRLTLGADVDGGPNTGLYINKGAEAYRDVRLDSGSGVAILNAAGTQLRRVFHFDSSDVVQVGHASHPTSVNGSQIGLYGVTPVSRPAALTQTYSTASSTHAALTSAAPATYTGITNAVVGTVYAQVVDLNALGTIVANLRTDVTNVKNFLNQVVDHLQSLGALQ